MKVRKLLEILNEADPDAIVSVFPPYADPSDGGPVGDVIVEEHAWPRETGLCEGRQYGTFYPWGPIPRRQPKLQQKRCGLFSSETLTAYPRMAATVWDLVARGIVITLTGREELPVRPQSPDVPVHKSSGDRPIPYIRFREIPEPARTLFKRNMRLSTCPVIDEDPEPLDCAYLWDWAAFLAGSR